MSRSERLLDLIQTLRRHRRPVSGQALAGELGVSIRTFCRDIATLQGQGAAALQSKIVDDWRLPETQAGSPPPCGQGVGVPSYAIALM